MIPDSFYLWLLRIEYVAVGILLCKSVSIIKHEYKLKKERDKNNV